MVPSPGLHWLADPDMSGEKLSGYIWAAQAAAARSYRPHHNKGQIRHKLGKGTHECIYSFLPSVTQSNWDGAVHYSVASKQSETWPQTMLIKMYKQRVYMKSCSQCQVYSCLTLLRSWGTLGPPEVSEQSVSWRVRHSLQFRNLSNILPLSLDVIRTPQCSRERVYQINWPADQKVITEILWKCTNIQSL